MGLQQPPLAPLQLLAARALACGVLQGELHLDALAARAPPPRKPVAVGGVAGRVVGAVLDRLLERLAHGRLFRAGRESSYGPAARPARSEEELELGHRAVPEDVVVVERLAARRAEVEVDLGGRLR